MKSPRIRIQALALAFILLPAVTGIVAVNASATCERFVRTYVTTPVRNRVRRTTVAAWAAWRVAHPDWKPNPKLHRPKYVMNRQESVQKIDFACSVPLLPTVADGLLTEADVPPPIVSFSPMEATQVTFPDQIPPEVAELAPQDTWPTLSPLVPPILGGGGLTSFPTVPPETPPVVGPVPEPSSLLLVGAGMASLCLLLAARMRTNKDSSF